MTPGLRDVTILITWSKNLIFANADISKNIVFMKKEIYFIEFYFELPFQQVVNRFDWTFGSKVINIFSFYLKLMTSSPFPAKFFKNC